MIRHLTVVEIFHMKHNGGARGKVIRMYYFGSSECVHKITDKAK